MVNMDRPLLSSERTFAPAEEFGFYDLIPYAMSALLVGASAYILFSFLALSKVS